MIYLIKNLFKNIICFFLKFTINIGKSGLLLKSILNITDKNNTKISIYNFIKLVYFIGVLSLSIIILSGFFIGMVVGLQGYYILKNFGAEQVIGQMVALTIIRELGPVVCALLFAGRTGASLTTEIGLMKSTEQLSYIEAIGIDSIRSVIAPRFWACILSMIMLSIIFTVIAIMGSYVSTVYWLYLDNDVFWTSIQDSITLKLDILNSIIKSVIFGIIVSWVSLYQGIYSKSTPEGISISTTNTVVYSSFLILGLNFLLTAIMFQWK